MAACALFQLVRADTPCSSLSGCSLAFASGPSLPSAVSTSTRRLFAANRAALGASARAAVNADAAQGGTGGKDDKESVDVLPSGEWAHNFSMLNYEDLHAHYENKDQGKGTEAVEPSSPLLPDQTHGVVSGEWSKSISILSYEDLSAFFQQQLFKSGASPDSLVADVMKREVKTAFPEDTVGELLENLRTFPGMPVVDSGLVCIGVLRRKDSEKADPNAKVKDVMISPPKATITPDKTILYAAALMLKCKVHKVPVVNEGGQVVGIIDASDIFTVLENVD